MSILATRVIGRFIDHVCPDGVKFDIPLATQHVNQQPTGLWVNQKYSY